MTTKRTLRESNKRLSPKYRFIRTLSSFPATTAAFRERDSRINRVSPVKDIAILEPMLLDLVEFAQHQTGEVTFECPRVLITRDNTDWPFRIEYIEQLLDVNDVWIVLADGTEPGRVCDPKRKPGEISLDMMHIEKPIIARGGETSPVSVGIGPPMRTEKELRSLELTPPRIIRSVEQRWMRGARPEQLIDLFLCNILPKRLAMYNCTFYNRDVAHLYMESLSEHIKRFANT